MQDITLLCNNIQTFQLYGQFKGAMADFNFNAHLHHYHWYRIIAIAPATQKNIYFERYRYQCLFNVAERWN